MGQIRGLLTCFLALGLAGCTLLGSPGTSWNRPYPVNQVLVMEQYQVILSPRSIGTATQLVFCLKRVRPPMVIADARVMATVGLLDQTVQSLDLQYEPGSQCYRGVLFRPVNTARRFLIYVQIGQERQRLMFQQ